MSILDTLMGQQSAALRIAESANRFGDIAKAAELAVSVGAGANTHALATHISAISAAQKSFATAFEPASAMAAQLQLFDKKMLAVLAPIKEATEKMSALSAAIKINTSFYDLGKVPAFTQIRLFEKITGECLLKFDESDLLKKLDRVIHLLQSTQRSRPSQILHLPSLCQTTAFSITLTKEPNDILLLESRPDLLSLILLAELNTHPTRYSQHLTTPRF